MEFNNIRSLKILNYPLYHGIIRKLFNPKVISFYEYPHFQLTCVQDFHFFSFLNYRCASDFQILFAKIKCQVLFLLLLQSAHWRHSSAVLLLSECPSCSCLWKARSSTPVLRSAFQVLKFCLLLIFFQEKSYEFLV